MKERQIVVITLSVLLVAAGYWIWSLNKPSNFVVREVFADSTYNGKIYFAFISTNAYNETDMLEYGKNFLTEQVTLDVLKKDLPVIAVVQYFNLEDTIALNDELKIMIRKKYPHIENPEKYLQCVNDGYIFTGFSKRIEGLKVPKDTLFQTSVIIPKNGVRAKDVLRVKRISDKIDSLSNISEDSLEVNENGNN